MSPAAALRARLEAALLLLWGVGSGILALGPGYARLMNPAFRAVTLAGAVLITAFGVALVLRPRRRAAWGAVWIFGIFATLVVATNPFAGGVADLIDPALATPPGTPPARPGYAPLTARALFRNLREEHDDVPPGRYVLAGAVHTVAGLEADQVLLLEPLMTCCLADAVSLGLRAHLGDAAALPDGTWVYAYGALRRLDTPVATPPFRLGAIAFSAISRQYVLDVDAFVTFRSLLADVVDKLPAQCGRFAEALARSDLAETLRGDGPFTLFAPIDAAFDPATARVADFVVAGTHREHDLFRTSALTAHSGRTLEIEAEGGRLRVAGARILFADDLARNGVVHIVHPAWSAGD